MVIRLRAAEQHVLVVVGEADLATAEQLRLHLADALPRSLPSLLVDLSGLDFCDLIGMDALHDASRQAEAAGVQLTFRGMSPQLAWLARTFPPRGPVRPAPPRSASGGLPDVRAVSGPRTAPSPDDAVPPAARAAAPAPLAPGRAETSPPRPGSAVTEPGRQHHPTDLRTAAGRYTSARAARVPRGAGDDLHAVPRSDTTRSAACGVRVVRSPTGRWDERLPGRCSDCSAALAAAALADAGANTSRTGPALRGRGGRARSAESVPTRRPARPPRPARADDDAHERSGPAA